MNPAIQKTLTLVFLIILGFLLKGKVKSPDQRKGIKIVILSVALPATIFVALLKIQIAPALLYLPIAALAINLLMFFIADRTVSWFGIKKDSSEARTWRMLMPSLAPGLSCFPFLIEYATEESLALAALADVGNKVFVLIILYLVAMKWYSNTQNLAKQSSSERVKSLLLSLVKEPVNIVILVAIVLLIFGQNMASLPAFLQDSINRMSLLMTPMVLLFIGMAVKIDWQQFKKIGGLLVFRAGCAFIISGLLLLVLPSTISVALAIVIVAFPQSAVSFWPFAHMSSISDLEEASSTQRTFHTNLALNILALSLPLSTIIILVICSIQSFFLKPVYLLLIGGGLLAITLLPLWIGQMKSSRVSFRKRIKEMV